jgi:hypothetical protein
MPLLTASGGVADYICPNCGAERHLTTADWVLPADSFDESVFSSPMCPCGTNEVFSWHDAIYPSHLSGGARHMVLIERVATALGRKKRQMRQVPGRKYEQEPKAPLQRHVREHTARLVAKSRREKETP